MASVDKVQFEDLENLEKVLLELSPTNEKKPQEQEEAMSMTVDLEEEEEEIVILECNIYKYHGADEASSHDDQVSEGILKFQYRDEDDEDIIEVDVVDKGVDVNSSLDLITIEDEEDGLEDEIEEDEDCVRDKEQVLTCDECGMNVLENQLEDHKYERHKTKERHFKTFENGNFFMLAD